jgi:hypothetical protein
MVVLYQTDIQDAFYEFWHPNLIPDISSPIPRWFFQQLVIGVDFCHRRGEEAIIFLLMMETIERLESMVCISNSIHTMLYLLAFTLFLVHLLRTSVVGMLHQHLFLFRCGKSRHKAGEYIAAAGHGAASSAP